MSPAQPILRFGLDSYLSVVLKSIWMRIRDLSLEGLSLEEEEDAQSRLSFFYKNSFSSAS